MKMNDLGFFLSLIYFFLLLAQVFRFEVDTVDAESN